MSTETKHTPAPWTAHFNGSKKLGSYWQVWPCLGLPRVCSCTDGERAEANARLIAAAPDLLEACRDALSFCQPNPPMYRQIQSAIAKAEGLHSEKYANWNKAINDHKPLP